LSKRLHFEGFAILVYKKNYIIKDLQFWLIQKL